MIAVEVRSKKLESQILSKIAENLFGVSPNIVILRRNIMESNQRHESDDFNLIYTKETDLPHDVTHILSVNDINHLDDFFKNGFFLRDFQVNKNYIWNGNYSPNLKLKNVGRWSLFRYFSLEMTEADILVCRKNYQVLEAGYASQLSALQKLAHFSKRNQSFMIDEKILNFLKSSKSQAANYDTNLVNKIKIGREYWVGVISPVLSYLGVNRNYLNIYSRQLIKLKKLNFIAFVLFLFFFSREKNKFTLSFLYNLGQRLLRPNQKDQFLRYSFKRRKVTSKASTSISASTFNQITKLRSETQTFTIEKKNYPIDEGFKENLSKHLKITEIPNVVVFCLDDYSTNIGGVQFYLDLESSRLQELGGNHVAVYPKKYSSYLQESVSLEVVVNRKRIGQISSDYLENFFELVQNTNSKTNDTLIIGLHALLGHDVKNLRKALASRKNFSGYFYIHDYYSLCPSVKLMRNDWVFCEAPSSGSTSCKVCIYGNFRGSHEIEIGKLLELESIKVISPSQVAGEIWSRSKILQKDYFVFPHAYLEKSIGDGLVKTPNSKPKVAFIGHQTRAKGWHSFYAVFRGIKNSEIDFYLFGRDNPQIPGIEFIELLNTGRNSTECMNLLSENGIDYVFIWPEWPETFSYVTIEAIAAGCKVITNENSGNVRILAQRYEAILISPKIEDCLGIMLKDWSENVDSRTLGTCYQLVHQNYLIDQVLSTKGE